MLAFLDSLCVALLARDTIRIRQLLAHPLSRALPRAVREDAYAIAGGSSRGSAAPLQAMRLYHQNETEIRQLINQKRYEDARSKLLATRGLLEAARADAQPPGEYTVLMDSLNSLGKYIDSEKQFTEQEIRQKRRPFTRGS